jgi:hypothetical protein
MGRATQATRTTPQAANTAPDIRATAVQGVAPVMAAAAAAMVVAEELITRVSSSAARFGKQRPAPRAGPYSVE